MLECRIIGYLGYGYLGYGYLGYGYLGYGYLGYGYLGYGYLGYGYLGYGYLGYGYLIITSWVLGNGLWALIYGMHTDSSLPLLHCQTHFMCYLILIYNMFVSEHVFHVLACYLVPSAADDTK